MQAEDGSRPSAAAAPPWAPSSPGPRSQTLRRPSPPGGDVRGLAVPEPLRGGGARREETPAAPTMADRRAAPARPSTRGRGGASREPAHPRPAPPRPCHPPQRASPMRGLCPGLLEAIHLRPRSGLRSGLAGREARRGPRGPGNSQWESGAGRGNVRR